jgi:hypothetical protein
MNTITRSIVRAFCQLIYWFRTCEDAASEMLSGKVHTQKLFFYSIIIADFCSLLRIQWVMPIMFDFRRDGSCDSYTSSFMVSFY